MVQDLSEGHGEEATGLFMRSLKGSRVQGLGVLVYFKFRASEVFSLCRMLFVDLVFTSELQEVWSFSISQDGRQ